VASAARRKSRKTRSSTGVESYYGNFSRTFALPDVIDEDAIKAESKDGVLTIRVPKAQAEVKKLTTIKVQ